MEKGSEKDIAKRNNISTNSVNRILDSICDDKLIKNNVLFLYLLVLMN